MKRWIQQKYHMLSRDNNWLPVASHCSRPNCKDNDCPVNREMERAVHRHYMGLLARVRLQRHYRGAIHG